MTPWPALAEGTAPPGWRPPGPDRPRPPGAVYRGLVLVLCMDTATPAISVALVELAGEAAPEVVAEATEVGARRHGELLAPLVRRVLATAGAGAGDIGAVAEGLGPGPYTSPRGGLPAYGACSLDLLAAQAGLPCVVVTDARRGEVYWARYTEAGRAHGPSVSAPAALAAELSPEDVVVGDGARRYAGELGWRPGPPWHAAAGQLGPLVADRVRRQAPGEVLVPLYLRAPDATPPAPGPRLSVAG